MVEDQQGEVYAHAVNLAEVFYGTQSAATTAGLLNPKAVAEAEIQKLFSYSVRERNDTADLISQVRTNTGLQGACRNLVLGDALTSPFFKGSETLSIDFSSAGWA